MDGQGRIESDRLVVPLLADNVSLSCAHTANLPAIPLQTLAAAQTTGGVDLSQAKATATAPRAGQIAGAACTDCNDRSGSRKHPANRLAFRTYQTWKFTIIRPFEWPANNSIWS